jgi:long-chain fatty acid transport protein
MRLARMERRTFCAVGAVLCAGVMSAAPALAGGFAVREQSTSGLGSAFAGIAVGSDLSSMYWNSAAAANVGGANFEDHVTLILPSSSMTATGGSLTAFGAESGDISGPTLVGAGYYNYQVNDQLFFGLAVNSPFGFVTKPDNHWAGDSFAQTSQIFSINFNPMVAYKVSPQLTIGAGMQFQYIDVTLSHAAAARSGSPTVRLEGDDFGVGVTAGLILTPVQGTSIGVGYRSAIGVDLEGDMTGGSWPGGMFGPGRSTAFGAVGAAASFYLPEQVTVSLRQTLAPKWTLLGTVEWSNWSRLGQIDVVAQNNGGYLVAPLHSNQSAQVLNLNWNDGWFFSGGLEYEYDPAWTFRGGVAWELSPIEASNRNVFLPDSNRLWLSVGLTHKLTERATIDLAYSHVFFDDAPITLSGLQAVGHTDLDMVSASFKYRWGGVPVALEDSLK